MYQKDMNNRDIEIQELRSAVNKLIYQVEHLNAAYDNLKKDYEDLTKKYDDLMDYAGKVCDERVVALECDIDESFQQFIEYYKKREQEVNTVIGLMHEDLRSKFVPSVAIVGKKKRKEAADSEGNIP